MEKTIEVVLAELEKRFADKQGTEGCVDFPSWLSFFAFDVISGLTWGESYGFVLRGEDVLGIIGWNVKFLQYGFIVSSS